MLLRETFVKVGGYDTDLFYGLEELDISSEIIKENKKIIYYPEVEIIHEPKKSVVDKRSKLKDKTTSPAIKAIESKIVMKHSNSDEFLLTVQ